MKVMVKNSNTMKVPILTAVVECTIVLVAVKIGILNVIEFITSIFILLGFHDPNSFSNLLFLKLTIFSLTDFFSFFMSSYGHNSSKLTSRLKPNMPAQF